ncbi:MAG: ABC transporter ATP-binding protein [Ottowia sp.]|uniref:ABC transporter ATP-binding protein n=1 Tax=Ottowia sp. TaxID=1898956 RepID=UPI003C72517C
MSESSASSQSPILEVKELSLRFGGIRALNEVSFSVESGSITALIGPNGAGKTSLFNCISGFYKPFSGSVWFRSKPITALPPPARARIGLARTFQNIALFRGMSVLDNIKLGRHAHMHSGLLDGLFYWGRARREEESLTHEIDQKIIDVLELGAVRDQPVATLAYGMRKRVELARALAMRPALLLLDEPVAGMNREETEDIARLILRVRDEWQVSVLMVEHDMGMVMDISDHVAVLNFGRLIAQDHPDSIQRNPEVITAYLGANAAGQLAAESTHDTTKKTLTGEALA